MKKLLIVLVLFALLVSLASCGDKGNEKKNPKEDVVLSVVMPDGAPALAMSMIMSREENKSFEFSVVDSSTIATYVSGDKPKADVCILPVNLAAKLLGSGEVYRLLGTVTHGNLFLLSQNTEIEYDKDNLSQLVGKTVGVIQLANVPGLTFKSVLNKYGIPWVEMGNGDEVAADKVNLKALTDASEVIPNGGCDVYLAPEPAASLKVSKTPLAFVGNLQTLYGGSNGYPQAVIVAKKSVIDAYPELISSLKKDLSDTSAWLLADSTDPDVIVDAIAKFATPGMTPSLNKNNLSKDAVRNSGVWFTPSSDCKEEIVAFLQSVMEINPASAAVPADVFFEN